MPIELVRLHPEPPLFANSTVDGLYEAFEGIDDPERVASMFAYENGLDVGESVWLGWGEAPTTSDDWDYDVAHHEEWVVLWTDDKGRPLVLPAAPGWLTPPSEP